VIDVEVAFFKVTLAEREELLLAVGGGEIVLRQDRDQDGRPFELLRDLLVEQLVPRQPPLVAPHLDAPRPEALTDRLAQCRFELLDPPPLFRSVRLVVPVAVTDEHLLGCHGESLSTASGPVNGAAKPGSKLLTFNLRRTVRCQRDLTDVDLTRREKIGSPLNIRHFKPRAGWAECELRVGS